MKSITERREARHKKTQITVGERLRQMRQDRQNGMSNAAIALKHHLRLSSVRVILQKADAPSDPK